MNVEIHTAKVSRRGDLERVSFHLSQVLRLRSICLETMGTLDPGSLFYLGDSAILLDIQSKQLTVK